MKTIKQLKKMIQDAESIFESPISRTKDLKKAHKLSAFYRSAIQYLETNPREYFIITEIERVKTRINQIESGYPVWVKSNPYEHAALKEPRKAYERSMDLAGVKRQLNFLKFILAE